MKINAAIPLIHHLILLAKVKFSKVKIKFQGSGLAPGACRPLLGDERVETGSISSKGSKGVGAAHKKSEAPRSINRAMQGDARRSAINRLPIYGFLTSSF